MLAQEVEKISIVLLELDEARAVAVRRNWIHGGVES